MQNDIADKLNGPEVFWKAKHERDILEHHGMLKPRVQMVKVD